MERPRADECEYRNLANQFAFAHIVRACTPGATVMVDEQVRPNT